MHFVETRFTWGPSTCLFARRDTTRLSGDRGAGFPHKFESEPDKASSFTIAVQETYGPRVRIRSHQEARPANAAWEMLSNDIVFYQTIFKKELRRKRGKGGGGREGKEK